MTENSRFYFLIFLTERMKRKFAWFEAIPIFVLNIFLLSTSGQSSLNNQTDSEFSCEILYHQTQDVWLMGETAAGSPLAAQLLAVYSFVPIALLLRTDLVVKEIWVHEPVKNIYGEVIEWLLAPAPFSTLFDMNHYTSYWARHKLKVISYKMYDSCFDTPEGTQPSLSTQFLQIQKRIQEKERKKQLLTQRRGRKSTRREPTWREMEQNKLRSLVSSRSSEGTQKFSHKIIELRRIPEFFPYKRQDFRYAVYFANISTTYHFKMPFASHQQIRVNSRYKLTGFYSFWNDTDLLKYTYSALKPAAPIENVVTAIKAVLPKPYVALHIRLDEDGFSQWGINQKLGELELTNRIVYQIIQSPCLQEFVQITNYADSNNDATIVILTQPTLYISTNFLANETKSQLRKKQIFDKLINLGFSEIYNTDRMHFLSQSYEKKVQENPNILQADPALHSHLSQLSILNTFSPEQVSYIDLLVSRASACFVPSVIPSFHSYLIERLRKLERKVYEKYDDVNEKTYGSMYFYRDWGF